MQNPITVIRGTYENVVGELKKCTWPTRQELTESTLVVIVSVLLLSCYVWGLDSLSSALIKGLTRFASMLNG